MKVHSTTYVWLAGGLIGLVMSPVSIATATSAGTTSDKATSIPQTQSRDQFTSIIKEALHHAREADAAGSSGDGKGLAKHAQKALEKAKEGQRAGHNQPLNDGVYALGEAIEHADKHPVDATEHIKRAIMKLSQSAGLQIPEGVPTGEGAGAGG